MERQGREGDFKEKAVWDPKYLYNRTCRKEISFSPPPPAYFFPQYIIKILHFNFLRIITYEFRLIGENHCKFVDNFSKTYNIL